ncbi:MAG: exopolysaccharide biosynthesis polyprenyl glycosylphosphotransferase [Actinobacteria bacterium]|nr:exopolysaccharide biosynthesis polyprenyl glycosylphosphotransferase [Actinomycetota bacterium]
MPVREVLLDRDVRAPEILALRSVPWRYLLRRAASVGALCLVDGIAIVAAIEAARAAWLLAGHRLSRPSPFLLVVLLVSVFSLLAVNGLYGLREKRQQRRRALWGALWVLVGIVGICGVADLWSLGGMVAVWVFATVFAFLLRSLYDVGLHVVFGFDPESKRAVLVGSPRALPAFAESMRRYPSCAARMNVLGIVESERRGRRRRVETGTRVLGELAELENIVVREHPDELVVIDTRVERGHLLEMVRLCRRRKLSLKVSNADLRFRDELISLMPEAPLPLFVSAPREHNALGWILKRGGELLLAAALLLLTLPLTVLIAVAIKLDSRGPVFYIDDRVGLGQRVFRCYKFRSMRADASRLQASLEAHNEADGAIFKLKDDPRVTRVGRVLRKTSLDELPQLLNVLRGEMSLVGPRPLPLRDNELMEDWHKLRHVVLPGITGMWQVSGRSDAGFARMIELDLAYIDGWSPWLDLRILAKTVASVAGAKGAY